MVEVGSDLWEMELTRSWFIEHLTLPLPDAEEQTVVVNLQVNNQIFLQIYLRTPELRPLALMVSSYDCLCR